MVTTITIFAICLIIAAAVLGSIIQVQRKQIHSLEAMVDENQYWQSMYNKLFNHSLMFDTKNYLIKEVDNAICVVYKSKYSSTMIKQYEFTDDDEKEYARICAEELIEVLKF
jgi:hypothetical protein